MKKDWDGIEKRQFPQEWHEILFVVRDLQKEQEDIKQKMINLSQEVEKYRPSLIILSKNEESWRGIKNAILEKSIAGIVWAILIGMALAAWSYFLSLVHKP